MFFSEANKGRLGFFLRGGEGLKEAAAQTEGTREFPYLLFYIRQLISNNKYNLRM